jgi:hypothetical protein
MLHLLPPGVDWLGDDEGNEIFQATGNDDVLSALKHMIEIVPRYKQIVTFVKSRYAKKIQRAWRKRRQQLDTPLAERRDQRL